MKGKRRMNTENKTELREIEKYKQDFSVLPLVNRYNAVTEGYDWYKAENFEEYCYIGKALKVFLNPPHAYPAYIGYCTSNGIVHTLDESLDSITRYLWNFDINVSYEEPLQKTERQLYEEYKFRWLAKHGYTLTDAISSAMKYAERIGLVGEIDEIISKWEEVGFDGKIYDSFEEWLEGEFEDCYQPFFRAKYEK